MRGRRLGGRYVLEEIEEEGGAAVCYRARDSRIPGRVVRTKVLHGSRGPSPHDRERFHRERTLLRGLDHPNLLQLYDAGRDGETDWMVTDHPRYGTFDALLRAEGRLDEGTVLEIAVQAGAALAAVHRAGVVHGAVHPSNLFFTDGGTVLLADLAAASVMGEGVSLRPDGVATSAPERYGGPESDVYGFAATLVLLLTGHPPRGLGDRSLGDPRWGVVPGWMRAVLRRALAEDPAERFASAERFVDALLDAALRYRRPNTEVLCARWEAIRPRGFVPPPTVDAPKSVEPPPQQELRWWRLPAALVTLAIGLLLGGLAWAVG